MNELKNKIIELKNKIIELKIKIDELKQLDAKLLLIEHFTDQYNYFFDLSFKPEEKVDPNIITNLIDLINKEINKIKNKYKSSKVNDLVIMSSKKNIPIIFMLLKEPLIKSTDKLIFDTNLLNDLKNCTFIINLSRIYTRYPNSCNNISDIIKTSDEILNSHNIKIYEKREYLEIENYKNIILINIIEYKLKLYCTSIYCIENILNDDDNKIITSSPYPFINKFETYVICKIKLIKLLFKPIEILSYVRSNHILYLKINNLLFYNYNSVKDLFNYLNI